MRHRLAVLTAVLAVAGLAACSHDKDDEPTPQAQVTVPGGSTAPLPGASSSLGVAPGASSSVGVPPGASGTAPAGTKPSTPGPGPNASGPARGKGLPTGADISAAGFGPYAIGVAQADLSSAGLVGKVSTDSSGCGRGNGVSKYHSPALVFAKGKLEHIKVTSAKVKTTEGVRVGTTFADVKGSYPEGK